MSLSGFIKNIRKLIGFTLIRPMKRFNVYNRAQKYLGPDAKYFMPAPRAIGPMSNQGKNLIQYPHLIGGNSFKSVQQRRLEAIERVKLTAGDQEANNSMDVSEAEKFVVNVSGRLEVTKTLVKEQATRNLPPSTNLDQIEAASGAVAGTDNQRSHRPLPTMTSLQLNDPASIWVVEKTPPGRLNLDQLQEIMLNKIDDPDNYWTPENIAEKYKIKAEYAESLCNYLKHVRIHLSPKLAKLLEYTGRNDEIYQASKHLVYIVDNDLRSEQDKQYDDMYLPTDKLDDEVNQVVGDIRLNDERSVEALRASFNRLERQIEPLRIQPKNKALEPGPHLIGHPSLKQQESVNEHLVTPKPPSNNNIST